MGLRLAGVINVSSVVLFQDMKIHKKIGAGWVFPLAVAKVARGSGVLRGLFQGVALRKRKRAAMVRSSPTCRYGAIAMHTLSASPAFCQTSESSASC